MFLSLLEGLAGLLLSGGGLGLAHLLNGLFNLLSGPVEGLSRFLARLLSLDLVTGLTLRLCLFHGPASVLFGGKSFHDLRNLG